MIILIFYYGEYFTITGDHITIDKDDPNKITYEYPLDVDATAYGNIDLTNDGRRYVWNFKCLEIKPEEGSGGVVKIGINNSRDIRDLVKVHKKTKKYYEFKSCYSSGNMYNMGYCTKWAANQSYLEEDPDWYSSDEEFVSGDQVRMELDTKHKTLIYYKNKKKIGNWITDVQLDPLKQKNFSWM